MVGNEEGGLAAAKGMVRDPTICRPGYRDRSGSSAAGTSRRANLADSPRRLVTRSAVSSSTSVAEVRRCAVTLVLSRTATLSLRPRCTIDRQSVPRLYRWKHVPDPFPYSSMMDSSRKPLKDHPNAVEPRFAKLSYKGISVTFSGD